MILYFGNVRLIDGNPTGEAITLKINNFEKTVFHIVSNKNRITQIFTSFWLFVRYFRKVKMVHIASYSTLAFYNSIYLATLCLIFRKPYIVVVHGGNYPARLRKSPRLCRFLFLNSEFNISPSKYLVFHLQNNSIPVQCIPNFIRIENYLFTRREVIAPNLLWVRSFHKIYNATMAAESLHLLLKKYPKATLCMVGGDKDGSLLEFKKKCEELGIENQVQIKGFMKREEWVVLSKQYDIFINTTSIDNTPMSVIEAMALGMPVVSTNVGGIPFLLEDGVDALLVEHSNAVQMADAICRLLENPELVNKVTKHARLKSETFSWESVQKDWQLVFEKVLNSAKK